MREELNKATRLVPCSVILLSVGTEEEQDAMTATAMFVAEDVPLLMISVSKNSTCYELIEKTGELVLNVASTDQVGLAKKVGATHGRDVNKFKEFGIDVEKGSKIGSPLIKGSFANLECKVITSMPVTSYMVYLVEVVAFKQDDSQTPVGWLADRYFSLDKEAR
jgi:flavin reductase (DIM6/NTAB) family NADH-FMN oxidoreductase RutF